MSEKNSVCIICSEGASSNKRLINNPDMIDELVYCCNERLFFGQSEFKHLTDRVSSLSVSERPSACYHSECRKPIVNKSMIERLRSKRVRDDSNTCLAPGPGRPSNATVRPKRSKTVPKAEICLFSTCSFCPKDTSEPLHRVFSNNMGENFIEIKLKTQDDLIRTCVSDLEGAGDASALEKYYHRKCLRSAQRSFTPLDHSNAQFIRSVCDEQLLLCVQNTLTDDEVIVSLAR